MQLLNIIFVKKKVGIKQATFCFRLFDLGFLFEPKPVGFSNLLQLKPKENFFETNNISEP